MTPSHPGARRLQVLCVLAAPKGWPLQPPLGSLGPPGEVAPGWTVRLGCGAGSRSEGCQQGPRTPRGRRAGMLTREIEVVVQRPGVGALCCLLKRPAEKARDTEARSPATTWGLRPLWMAAAPRPKPSPAQPSGECAPHAPQSCVGPPRHAWRGGMGRGRGGEKAQGTGIQGLPASR